VLVADIANRSASREVRSVHAAPRRLIALEQDDRRTRGCILRELLDPNVPVGRWVSVQQQASAASRRRPNAGSAAVSALDYQTFFFSWK
jgi:hypothetical protein